MIPGKVSVSGYNEIDVAISCEILIVFQTLTHICSVLFISVKLVFPEKHGITSSCFCGRSREFRSLLMYDLFAV